MNKKQRRKILDKLAQTADNTAVPTPAAAQTANILPPPQFQASAMYPGIRTGYNAASVSIIDQLVNVLNIAVHYITSGKLNFQIFRNDNFNFDSSQAPDVNQRRLMELSKLVFAQFLNRGSPFAKPMTPQEIENRVEMVWNNPNFQGLSQANPTGIVAQKIGNPQRTIYNILLALKNANPITHTAS